MAKTNSMRWRGWRGLGRPPYDSPYWSPKKQTTPRRPLSVSVQPRTGVSPKKQTKARRSMSVSVQPTTVDLGDVTLGAAKRFTLTVSASGRGRVWIRYSVFLSRTTSGRRAIVPLWFPSSGERPVQFAIDWAPIRQRGAQLIAAGRNPRPTGKISISWDGGSATVPVELTVRNTTGR